MNYLSRLTKGPLMRIVIRMCGKSKDRAKGCARCPGRSWRKRRLTEVAVVGQLAGRRNRAEW